MSRTYNGCLRAVTYFFNFGSLTPRGESFSEEGMPQNLLEPTRMELDSDDHFDCPERGRRTEHEVPGATRRFEDFIDTYAPDVGTGPRLPAELLCL
jgi:hypothetical protein